MRAAIALALASTATAIDECFDALNCTACLAPSHGAGNCGWCAPQAVTYADGTTGNRCADLRDKSHGGGWQCSGKLMKDQCLQGWVCGGAQTKYQCIPAALPGDGNPTFSACQAGCTPRPSFKCVDKTKGQCFACSDPNDPDCTTDYQKCQSGCVDTALYSCNVTSGTCEKCDSSQPSPSCVGKSECASSCSVNYECEYPSVTTAQPMCKPCTNPASGTCKYGSSDDCSKDCVWNYACDLTNPAAPTCKKAQHGIPKLQWCTEQCHVSYTCDEIAGTCNATQGGGSFTNLTACSSACPAKPTPVVPFELIGVWRGLELHNGFARGEWTANVTRTSFVLYSPGLQVYLGGSASHRVVTHQSITGELWVDSTVGQLKGTVKLVYGDANLEPELAYVSLGVSETAPSTPILSYDAGMTTPTDKVLGMLKCKSDANCKFHMPTLPAPPPSPASRQSAARSLSANDRPSAPRSAAVTAVATPWRASGDACNKYTTCNTCIANTPGPDENCGWCTTKVQYNDSSTPKYQCAGHKTGEASGWTCYGIFRTLSCYDYACDPTTQTCKQCAPGQGGVPTKAACDKGCSAPSPWVRCDFHGVYRGLQIDLNYPKGEWDLNFSVYSNFTTASFQFVPSGYSFTGKVLCRNAAHPSQVGAEGDFKLDLTNGTTILGIYQQGGNQAETEGLSIALSNLGGTSPPTDFKSAMPGLNASVYAFTKCADYKKGVCVF